MASNTTNFDLLKKDPATDGNNNFDIKTMMNDNWDKLDSNSVHKTLAQTLTNKTLTSPKIGTAILDTNGNEIIKTPATSNAVNEITIVNAAAGNGVEIQATGDDTNIDLKLLPKGIGKVKVGTNDVWHVGNDGTGSGLDADLVKGVNLADRGYLGASKEISNQNLDNYKSNGLYHGNNVTNSPNINSYYWFEVIGIEANWLIQRATNWFDYTTTYVRKYNDGVWSAWFGINADTLDGKHSTDLVAKVETGSVLLKNSTSVEYLYTDGSTLNLGHNITGDVKVKGGRVWYEGNSKVLQRLDGAITGANSSSLSISLPTGYDEYILNLTLAATTSTSSGLLKVTFNNDTTAGNYKYVESSNQISSNGFDSNSSYIASSYVGKSNTNGNDVQIKIINKSARKMVEIIASSDPGQVSRVSGFWKNTNTLSTIELVINATQIASGAVWELYGIDY